MNATSATSSETFFKEDGKIPKETLDTYFKKISVSNTKKNKWEFKASSMDFIDFEKIAKTLTSERPLAFITYGDNTRYVVINHYLYAKAAKLENTFPIKFKKRLPISANFIMKLKEGVVFRLCQIGDGSKFKEWIEWAREVKEAPWPKDGRKDNVVKVSLPKI